VTALHQLQQDKDKFMTSIFKCNGKTIRPGKSWTDDNGITHPKNWHIWSAAEKAERGITEIVQQPHPDSRLYTWSYNDDGTVNSTPKALEDTPDVDKNGVPVIDPDTFVQPEQHHRRACHAGRMAPCGGGFGVPDLVGHTYLGD
jgi:hypothetical protein